MSREHRVISLDADAAEVNPVYPQMAALADRVRSIYILCYREWTANPEYGNIKMPSWDGGEDSWGTKIDKPAWPKIAAKIVELEAEPITYIRAQFRAAKRRPPTPNQICDAASQERWQSYRQSIKQELANQYDDDVISIQLGVLPLTTTLRWEDSKALRYTLNNVRAVKASALIRYCMAIASGFEDVANYFFNQALLQYVFQQADYDEVWRTRMVIPEPLRLAATELRSRLVGR
jgi:hypothetical protein